MCGGGDYDNIDLDRYKDAFNGVASNSHRMMNERYNELQTLNEQNLKRTSQIIGMQIPELRKLYEFADSERARYQKDTIPMERKFMRDAAGYDTAARRDQASSAAMSDVAQGINAQRDNARMRLEGYGVDPSQTRYQGLDQQYGIGQALGQVQAGTQARNQVEQTGYALRGQAIQVGQQSNANAGNATNQAGALGSNVLQESNAAVGLNAQTLGTPIQYQAAQLQALSMAEQAKIQEYQMNAQRSQGQGGGLAGIGQAAGMIGGGLLGIYGGPAGVAAGATLGGALGGTLGGAAGGGPPAGGGYQYGGGLPTSWGSAPTPGQGGNAGSGTLGAPASYGSGIDQQRALGGVY